MALNYVKVQTKSDFSVATCLPTNICSNCCSKNMLGPMLSVVSIIVLRYMYQYHRVHLLDGGGGDVSKLSTSSRSTTNRRGCTIFALYLQLQYPSLYSTQSVPNARSHYFILNTTTVTQYTMGDAI